MGGRPTDHTTELALDICSRIAEGESVRSISLDKEMPNASTIHRWVLTDLHGFRKQYEEAKSIGAEVESDEMDNIARTEEDIQRAKLIIDTKKWNLSKKLPRRFGDKMDVTTDGQALTVSVPPAVAQAFNLHATTDTNTGEVHTEQK